MPPLLDTNILIYAFSDDGRAEQARGLLVAPFVLSVQALNEFSNVARRKLGYSWLDLRDAIADITVLAHRILPLDQDTQMRSLDIAERFGLSIYDALMLAAADRAGCALCLSEDMQHGMVIDGRVTIRNPFVAAGA